MSYLARQPEIYVGKIVGSGQCVAFVQAISAAPNTSLWTEGAKVRGTDNIPQGTVIATFKDGKYPNNSFGNHAAVFINQDAAGISVYDQWKGHPVGKRTIRFKAGVGSASNDGDAFSIVE